MRRLSVVIPNYNHERFVAEAITSALDVDWPDVEVLVVDDGSTDGSAAVITSFGDRVTALFTENAGHRVACNRGFAASTGDAVVFLDADDVLPPELARGAARVWAPDVSKVQVQMQRTDADGVPVGRPFPAFDPPPTAGQVRDWLRRTSAYPTPPGSGNVYARWFLDRVMPVGPETGEYLDSACLATAPLLGDVVSLPGVCVGYRQHESNDSRLLDDVTRFAREVERARARWVFAQRVAGGVRVQRGAEDVDERPLFRSRELLQLRVAARRTSAPGSPPPLPGDGPLRQVLDAVRSPTWPGPEPLRHRVLLAGWCVALGLAPAGTLVDELLRLRYAR